MYGLPRFLSPSEQLNRCRTSAALAHRALSANGALRAWASTLPDLAPSGAGARDPERHAPRGRQWRRPPRDDDSASHSAIARALRSAPVALRAPCALLPGVGDHHNFLRPRPPPPLGTLTVGGYGATRRPAALPNPALLFPAPPHPVQTCLATRIRTARDQGKWGLTETSGTPPKISNFRCREGLGVSMRNSLRRAVRSRPIFAQIPAWGPQFATALTPSAHVQAALRNQPRSTEHASSVKSRSGTSLARTSQVAQNWMRRNRAEDEIKNVVGLAPSRIGTRPVRSMSPQIWPNSRQRRRKLSARSKIGPSAARLGPLRALRNAFGSAGSDAGARLRVPLNIAGTPCPYLPRSGQLRQKLVKSWPNLAGASPLMHHVQVCGRRQEGRGGGGRSRGRSVPALGTTHKLKRRWLSRCLWG